MTAAIENLTTCNLDSEGRSINDPASILLTLYPALLANARLELELRGLNPQQAEDVVQTVCHSWCELVSVEQRAGAYMRKAIKKQVAYLGREGGDAMTRHPLSLDELQEGT